MWSHSMRPKAQHCRTGPQGLDNHIKLTNPSANTHNITCKEIALCTWPYFSLPFNQMPLKLVLSVQQSRPSPSRLLSLYHLHQTPSCPSYLQSIPQEQTHPFLEPLMGNNTVSTSAASHANSAPAAPIFMAVPCAMTPTMALLFWHKDFRDVQSSLEMDLTKILGYDTWIPSISMTFKKLWTSSQAGGLTIWQMGPHSRLRGIGQIKGTKR